MNEENLVERCLRQDRFAEEVLYNQFYDEMHLIALRYLRNKQDAEDVTILSFVKIFKNLKKFNYRGVGSLGKWARTILINESIRLLNKRKSLHFEEGSKLLSLKSINADAIEQIQATEIVKMINDLPNGYRTIFNLYVIEGYNHREISVMLKISENTSKTQLKKARTVLMNRINKENTYGN